MGAVAIEMVAREWRLSVDALGEELCLLDAEGRILRCNRAMRDRIGRPYEEILRQPCRRRVCAPGPCSPDCPLPRMRATVRRVTAEIPIGERVYQVTADPVLDDAGALTGAVLLLSDHTEARRSALFNRLLTDSIPSSVLLLDKSLRVVLANRNFLEKSRRTEPDTLGKPLNSVFPEVILEELGLEGQIRQVFGENRAKGGQRLTYRAPGVPIRVYFYSIVPVAWGSRVDHVLLLMDDITEQTRLSEEIHRMERHLASVVESASELVISTDSSGRIITWNKAAERISGYRFDQVTGQPLLEFFEEQDRAGAAESFEHEPQPNAAEWDLVTKAGKRRKVSWLLSPMMDDQGQRQGFVAVGRDLTERRKLEQQLAQSQKLAALGVMASGIAHEIRTPLAISSSAAQFLMEDEPTPEFRRECAEKVHEGIERASVIIENLLRFAQPASRADRSAVDLVQVVTNAARVIGSQARLQKVRAVTRLPDEPISVLGVASLLEQVCVNLLLNAIHAMPGGGTVEIAAERTSAEAILRVTDTGHGIEREDLDKIFDPFYSRAPAGKGIGLGLSLCYSIVKQHMGSIEVESEPARGSIFSVKLPLL